MRVLVAEDNLVTATYLRTALERHGWSVEVVTDGAQALEVIERERFDAVLADWILPVRDGIEVLQAVRAQGWEPPPYVAIITVVDSPAAQRYCLACGADACFTKPLNPADIIASIEEYYRNLQSQ